MPVTAITLFLIIWQCVSMLGLVPSFMLPSPVDVAKAFVKDFTQAWGILNTCAPDSASNL